MSHTLSREYWTTRQRTNGVGEWKGFSLLSLVIGLSTHKRNVEAGTITMEQLYKLSYPSFIVALLLGGVLAGVLLPLNATEQQISMTIQQATAKDDNNARQAVGDGHYTKGIPTTSENQTNRWCTTLNNEEAEAWDKQESSLWAKWAANDFKVRKMKMFFLPQPSKGQRNVRTYLATKYCITGDWTTRLSDQINRIGTSSFCQQNYETEDEIYNWLRMLMAEGYFLVVTFTRSVGPLLRRKQL